MTVRSTLDGILCDLQGVVADLDPESFRGEEAEHVLERFSKIERVAAAGKALCARRCVETNRHKAEGARNPGEWLGRKTGETQGRCLGGLETAEKLDGLVELDRQFRSGDLSVSQAREIAAAASLDPSSEAALLDLARRGSLKELRNEAERIKARARSKEEEAARQRRLHDSRYLRTWTGGDGAFLGSFSLTPTDGARLMAALQPAYDEIFASARRSGAHERPEAYMADALVAAVTGEITLEAGEEPLVPGSDTAAREGPVSSSGRGGKDNASPETTRSDLDPGVAGTDAGLGTSAGKDTGDPSPAGTRKPWVRHLGPSKVIVRVDLSALLRGRIEAGETCEIAGIGPVSVAEARSLLGGDVVLDYVLTHGQDIRAVVHFNRHINNCLQTALLWRDRTCVVPRCGAIYGLEVDHVVAVEDGGPTSLLNLALLCHHHHHQKTHDGYRLSYDEELGTWEWFHPVDTDAVIFDDVLATSASFEAGDLRESARLDPRTTGDSGEESPPGPGACTEEASSPSPRQLASGWRSRSPVVRLVHRARGPTAA